MICRNNAEVEESSTGTLLESGESVESNLAGISLKPGTYIGTVVEKLQPDGQQLLIEYSSVQSTTEKIPAEIARGQSAKSGDRVLFVMPANATLAVITAVLSPQTASPPCETLVASLGTSTSQQLVLQEAESLSVTTSTGKTLVAIESGATGPIIRLGEGSLELDMPGELHLMADSLRFTTRSGPVTIQSQSDDVVVQGRTIRLN